jgi:hypothetical protein
LRYGKSGKAARVVEDWREEDNREDLAGKRWVFWREEAVVLPLVVGAAKAGPFVGCQPVSIWA